jgi:hypothetical protein
MRKEWFDFVAKIRSKMKRKQKRDVTHVEAMREASMLWPAEKEKLIRRRKREANRLKRGSIKSRTAKIRSRLPKIAESPGPAAENGQV